MARRDCYTRAVLVAFLLLVGMGVASQLPNARAEPSVGDLGNGNRTAVWDFRDPSAYTTSGVEIGTGSLSLQRITSLWLQDRDSDFSLNGTPSSQIVVGGGSLRLKGNEGSLLGNGNFVTTANWTATNSPSGSVLASVGGGTGEFSHSTPSLSSQFDSLDSSSSWGSVSGPGATSIVLGESNVKVEGTGSLNDTISLTASTMWAGISRSSAPPWNFTLYNRISVWLRTTYTGSEQLFAVLHLESGFNTWDSPPFAIDVGWRRFDFPLTGFGAHLGAVSRMELRFTGAVVPAPGASVYIDDIWERSFKSTDERASIAQVLSKPTTNRGSNGSSILRWDYTTPSVRNATEAELDVSVRHADGTSMSWTATLETGGTWTSRSVDASPAMAAAGVYTITFSLRVRVDTDFATEVLAGIDNVVLLSPDYSDGEYVSIALNAGSPAAWGLVSWEEGGDPENISVDIRSGGSPVVGDSTWSYWTTYTNPAGETILAPPDTFLQFRIRLETSHSTRTPILERLVVDFSKFTGSGRIETRPFDPPERVLMWRRFDASAVVPAETAVSYEVSADGVTWQPLFPPGADLRGFNGDAIRLRASLSTTDSLQSPQIQSILVTYEFEGPLRVIRLSPERWQGTADESILFTASASDPWFHPLGLVADWDTSDPTGNVVGGLYQPGKVGTWKVRALSPDRSVVGEAVVVVLPGAIARLVLTPAALSGWTGSTVRFNLSGMDAESNPVTLSGVEWNTTGGSFIDRSPSSAVLRLPIAEGIVTVTARYGAISTTTDVTVVTPFLAQLLWPGTPIGIAAAVVAIVVWEVYFRYPHTLEDVFVITRDGRLVAHKTRRLRADRDEDVFAAMLAAIAAFVRDSFKEEKQELRQFSFGDRTVYVERGNFGYVAAIYGDAPPWVRGDLAAFVEDLERANGELLRTWSGDRDEVSGIAAMTEAFATRRRYVLPWRRTERRRRSQAPGHPIGRKPAS